MVINVDITSGAFYKRGPLIPLCLEYLEKSPTADPRQFLSEGTLTARNRASLAKFLRGLPVLTPRTRGADPRTIKNVSANGASNVMFESTDGQAMSVAVRDCWLRRQPAGC